MTKTERNSFIISIVLCFASAGCLAQQKHYGNLVWSDEFDSDGLVDSGKWSFENGFVRNYEQQWYSSDNAFQKDGLLVIEARQADFPCPSYNPHSGNWRNSRERVSYTSASITTKGKFSFRKGTLEVRARIPVCKGAWPAIWTLGEKLPWPANGEIDILEFYRIDNKPTILANACWASDDEEDPVWDSSYTALEHFTAKDPEWARKFHVWRLDWTDDELCIYLDDELLNRIDIRKAVNGKAGGRQGVNPFDYEHYLLLNLALDKRVDSFDPKDFPIRYEIDYVRLWQKD